MSRVVRSRAGPEAAYTLALGAVYGPYAASSAPSSGVCKQWRPDRRSTRIETETETETDTCGGAKFQNQAQAHVQIQRRTQFQINMTVIQ
ncbi:hypothetical protein [Natronosalvus halobius]|uniref:hypothetical protein n=1 Tax=Natronosalvus halobius TaxID=2953746 RepID=UPI00209E4575|nr:hypothetical protein [Natronosalvus halobius]USZ72135.1 hypothetical protein NGM15_02145 [Natronosalvus halobius]